MSRLNLRTCSSMNQTMKQHPVIQNMAKQTKLGVRHDPMDRIKLS